MQIPNTPWMMVLVLTGLFLVIGQPTALDTRIDDETMLLIKDTALALNALGTVAVTEFLIDGWPVARRTVLIGLATVAVGIDLAMWNWKFLGFLPPVAVTLYCLWCYGYVTRASGRYGRSAYNPWVRWRFRTLSLGFAFACLCTVNRSWIEASVTEVAAPINRIFLIATVVLMILGFTMPRWYGSLGVRFEILWYSRRYFDHLIGLVGMLYDLQVELRQPQLMSLAGLATQLGARLGFTQGQIDVVRAASQVASIRFARYNGAEVAPTQELPSTAHDSKDLGSVVEHFSTVYRCVSALLAPGHLSLDAPPEARVIRAAALYIDGAGFQQISEETGPEIARRLADLITGPT